MPNFNNLEPILGRHTESVSVSNSEIQTYKQCRRRWMLGNYYGLRSKDESMVGPLPLGTRVHNALEMFYANGEHPVDAYNRFQRQDAVKFLATQDAQDVEKVKKFDSDSELGRIMIEGYLEWIQEENIDDDIEFVSNEEKLDYRINEFDARVELIAKIDARVKYRSTDMRALLDFKTAAPSNVGDYLKYARFSEQLRHYAMLENLTSKVGDAKVDGGIYRILKKVKRSAAAKPPFYQNVEIRFNKQEMESFWIRTLGSIRDMMSTRDALDNDEDHRFVAYPTQKMDWTCGTCPFMLGCTMMDDGSNYEDYFGDNFKQDDPNARYAESETS